jgi:hypothetical protein
VRLISLAKKKNTERIFFTLDESRFTTTGNDGGARAIGKFGERYDAKHTVPKKKYGGGGVMIWSYFHANDFGPLVLL